MYDHSKLSYEFKQRCRKIPFFFDIGFISTGFFTHPITIFDVRDSMSPLSGKESILIGQ